MLHCLALAVVLRLRYRVGHLPGASAANAMHVVQWGKHGRIMVERGRGAKYWMTYAVNRSYHIN